MGVHAPSDVAIGPSPSELTAKAAFRIFSIAHQYNLQAILFWCKKAVERDDLDLWPEHDLVAPSEVSQYPGLFQWLAIADQKQSDDLVAACIAQLTLTADPNVVPNLRGALASAHLEPLLEGLRPETMIKAMRRLAGLTSGFQVGH